MPGIWSELKRRNVVKAALAYAAIGWLLIEVTSAIFPIYKAPDWVLQVLVTVILLGFPVAMVLSWVFDVTPEGVVRTGDVAGDRPARTYSGRRLDVVIAIVLVAAIAVFIAGRMLETSDPAETADTSPPAVAMTSVAVLPFVNLSGDPEQEYFADGLTEELLDRLAQIPDLRVPARSSAFHFKGKTDLEEVKAKLGVATVLQGSVRMSGSALRIKAELTDVDTGYNVWTNSYDRELTDIFAVQDEITSAIVAALEVHLDESLRARISSKPVDPELYQLMLRGRYHWNQRNEDSFAKALELFDEAVTKYPDYGPAYAGLADVYLSQFDYGLIGWDESTGKARIAATTALELDPSLAEAHTSLAHLHLHEWRWPLAERAFRRAIELDPGYIVARHWYALCLTALGRTDEAVTTMEHAQARDPLSGRINADLGMAYLAAGRYEDAVRQETETLELVPESATPRWIRGMAYVQLGKTVEAETDMRAVLEAWERDPSILGSLGHLLAISGRPDEARAMLAELEAKADSTDVTFFAALIEVGLGDTDAAFAWLDKAVAERSGSARYLRADVRLDPLRGDPRFAALLERVGLGAESAGGGRLLPGKLNPT